MSTVNTPVIETTSAPALIAVPLPQAPGKNRLPVFIEEDVLIPDWVVDHDSYRHWAKSDEFPTRGRFSFIDGMIWVDRTMEEFFSHNLVKTEYTVVVGQVVRSSPRGYFGSDGNLWTHPAVGISTEPDGLYFSYETLTSGRIRLIKGAQKGYIELEGTPDMILEIVSNSSVKKDTQIEKEKCAKAGVSEYWLVDARGAEPRFQIWGLQAGAYQLAADDNGWLTSSVFGKAFKLEYGKDPLGHPSFQLLVR